jgi:hypothetical protein
VSEVRGVGELLLDAIESRDYAAISECFASDARFDVLTPHRLRTHTTAREAADRYRYWLDRLGDFEVLERECAAIADRTRVRYLFRGRDPEHGWQLNEHTAYAASEEGRITAMTLTCAGFRPTGPPQD